MTPIHISREMFTQKGQDEIMNDILDVIKLLRLATTSGKSGKSASAKFANVGIVKNTVAISF